MSSNPSSRQAELASELLDVTSDRGLTEFLGGLVTETAWHAGDLPVAARRELVRSLRQTVVATVPTVAAAVGAGRPMAELPAGTSAAATAARMYGLELEGMSAEDRDYEIAQQFIRFAQAAITEEGSANVRDDYTDGGVRRVRGVRRSRVRPG